MLCLLLQEAVGKAVHDGLPASTGGVIAVDAQGNICMDFNCTGMFRAACDSDGHFCIGIYRDEEPLDLTAQLPEPLTTLQERPPRLRQTPRIKRCVKEVEKFTFQHMQWRQYVTSVPALSPRSEEKDSLLDRLTDGEQSEEGKSPVTN